MTHTRSLLFAIALTAGLCHADPAISPSASDALFQFVVSHADKLPSQTLAIVPLRYKDGSESMEGELLTERLVTDLSMEPELRIVERRNLEEALKEQQLALEGFVSSESAARAGRLTGAGAVFAGSLTTLGEIIEIHARLFSVETGEVIASEQIRARRTIRSFINPLWDDIDALKKTGKQFGARIWTEDDRIRIGDEATVKFEVDQTCYVTIFDYSTDGSITILFPNRFQPNNRVRPDITYQIPADDASYRIRAQGPPGIEHLKLLATTEDVPLYVRDYSKSPFNSVSDGDASGVRGLVTTLDDMPTSDWAEDSHEFLIERRMR